MDSKSIFFILIISFIFYLIFNLYCKIKKLDDEHFTTNENSFTTLTDDVRNRLEGIIDRKISELSNLKI